MKHKITSSKKVEIINISYEIGLRETEKLYDISKKTIISWRKKFVDGGIKNLELDGRKNNPIRKIDDDLKKRIEILWNENPKLSGRAIIEKLKLNCSVQSVLNIRKSISHHINENLSRWNLEYCSIFKGQNRKYIFTATEIESSFILFGISDDLYPANLELFRSMVCKFLTEIDIVFRLESSTRAFLKLPLKMEYSSDKCKIIKNIGNDNTMKFKSSKLYKSIKIDLKENDLTTEIDNIIFKHNILALSKSEMFKDFRLLLFQPQYISITRNNTPKLFLKELNIILEDTFKYIENEIKCFNFSVSENILSLLYNNTLLINDLATKARIQLHFALHYLKKHNYEKSDYCFISARKLASESKNIHILLEVDLYLTSYYLNTSQYNKCEILIDEDLKICKAENLKLYEGKFLILKGSLYKLMFNPYTRAVADQILEISISIDDKELYCDAMNLISSVYLSSGYYEKSNSWLQKAYYIAKSEKLSKVQFDVNFLFGELGLRTDNYRLADSHLSENLNEEISFENYNSNDIKNLIRLGLVKCKNREFNEGMDLLLKSLYLSKKRNDKYSESSSNNHLGQVFLNLLNFKKAAFYFNKAVKINQIIKNKEEQIIVLGCLSTCYGEMKQLKKAKQFALWKLKEVIETKNRIQIASAYGAIASVLQSENNLNKAEEFYNLQLKTLKPTDAELHKILALGNLGIIYLLKREFKKAKNYFKKAEKILLPLNNSFYLAMVYLDLMKIEEHYNNISKIEEYKKLAYDHAILSDNFQVLDDLSDI
ncbi:MAG: hypothetical protein JXR48_03855 [Candidatus Delongbacteria bacterium]|nr:hypothetical protein [Candidatus Delongbacteria bacterium]